MNQHVLFGIAAKQEFLEACEWYEQHRTHLGDWFESAFNATLNAIVESPNSFPLVHRDVRRALVRPFPYAIFHRLRVDAVHVLSVMHGHRNPKVWKSRIEGK